MELFLISTGRNELLKIYFAKGSRLLMFSYAKEKEEKAYISIGTNTNPVLTDCWGKQKPGLFQLLRFTGILKFEYHFFTKLKDRWHEKNESELTVITEISAIIVTEYKFSA